MFQSQCHRSKFRKSRRAHQRVCEWFSCRRRFRENLSVATHQHCMSSKNVTWFEVGLKTGRAVVRGESPFGNPREVRFDGLAMPKGAGFFRFLKVSGELFFSANGQDSAGLYVIHGFRLAEFTD